MIAIFDELTLDGGGDAETHEPGGGPDAGFVALGREKGPGGEGVAGGGGVGVPEIAASPRPTGEDPDGRVSWDAVTALMASDDWQERFAAVHEIRRTAAEAPRSAGPAAAAPTGVFPFLVREVSALRSKSSRNALACLGDVFAAGGPAWTVADEDVGPVVAALVRRACHTDLRFLADAARVALHNLCAAEDGDVRVFEALLDHAASKSAAVKGLVAKSAARVVLALPERALDGAFPVEALAHLVGTDAAATRTVVKAIAPRLDDREKFARALAERKALKRGDVAALLALRHPPAKKPKAPRLPLRVRLQQGARGGAGPDGL